MVEPALSGHLRQTNTRPVGRCPNSSKSGGLPAVRFELVINHTGNADRRRLPNGRSREAANLYRRRRPPRHGTDALFDLVLRESRRWSDKCRSSPFLTDLFRLEHPIAAPVELVLRKFPTVSSETKRSSSHSPHRGRNSTFRAFFDVGSPTCILAAALPSPILSTVSAQTGKHLLTSRLTVLTGAAD